MVEKVLWLEYSNLRWSTLTENAEGDARHWAICEGSSGKQKRSSSGLQRIPSPEMGTNVN